MPQWGTLNDENVGRTVSPPEGRARQPDLQPGLVFGAGVVGVDVDIADGDGDAVESGAATETPPDSGRWVYAAEADVSAGTTVRAR
jgi:hypothetical protein